MLTGIAPWPRASQRCRPGLLCWADAVPGRGLSGGARSQGVAQGELCLPCVSTFTGVPPTPRHPRAVLCSLLRLIPSILSECACPSAKSLLHTLNPLPLGHVGVCGQVVLLWQKIQHRSCPGMLPLEHPPKIALFKIFFFLL